MLLKIKQNIEYRNMKYIRIINKKIMLYINNGLLNSTIYFSNCLAINFTMNFIFRFNFFF